MTNLFRKVICWCLQTLVASAFLYASYEKFRGSPIFIDIFTHLSMEPEGRYLLVLLELCAALLLLLPHASPWGAMLGWGIMSGALIAHVTKIGFSGSTESLGLFAFVLWMACIAILILRQNQLRFIRNMSDRSNNEQRRDRDEFD